MSWLLGLLLTIVAAVVLGSGWYVARQARNRGRPVAPVSSSRYVAVMIAIIVVLLVGVPLLLLIFLIQGFGEGPLP
jgi:drug/metabolite transporter (DMT)-like permease